MVVNRNNLLAGISYWFNKKTHWPDDFHNSVYWNLADWQKDGINREWWEKIAGLLQLWQANRPLCKDTIISDGLPYIDDIRNLRTEIQNSYGAYPAFEQIKPDAIRPLFSVAEKIKKVQKKSPVFPSKLCHFLFPGIFFVADREAVQATGIDYFKYWEKRKVEWHEASDKEDLISILVGHIEKSKKFNSLFKHYPFPVKIVELCRIGYLNKTN